MNGVLKLITLLCDLIAFMVGKYREEKAQASADRIDADPAAEFMHRFKRTEKDSSTTSKPS
jgi:hypothetical protein